MLIAYGDNYGNFHAHRFDPTGFTKASKIVDKQRNANRVEFVQAGRMLAIGGMGYLSTYAYSGGKFAPLHDLSLAVRDFAWTDDGNLVLVNQGIHGVAAYQYGPNGFIKKVAPGPRIPYTSNFRLEYCWRYIRRSEAGFSGCQHPCDSPLQSSHLLFQAVDPLSPQFLGVAGSSSVNSKGGMRGESRPLQSRHQHGMLDTAGDNHFRQLVAIGR